MPNGKISRLLIANRGEIAIRIANACDELGIAPVSIFASDDASSLHVLHAERAVSLPQKGPKAYLDIDSIIAAAKSEGCDAVHPGYGFLSENQAFAEACEANDLIFVGPNSQTLALFGDKLSARQLAEASGVPLLQGSDGVVDLEGALSFFDSLGDKAAIMIKALAGGGGRGMRIVTEREELASAFKQCRSEAEHAFGNDAVLVEQFLPQAKHVEIQILGDGKGGVIHFGERECSLQRRHQKVIECAPAPGLSKALRNRLADAAISLAKSAKYRSLGTFEFLVDANGWDEQETANFFFMEANPRLQVEHTITEEAMDVDLVHLQLKLADGASFKSLGLKQSQFNQASRFALQLRVNMERMEPNGSATPTAGGELTAYQMPSGKGVRVDGYGYAGYQTNPRYDSLLAKIIVSASPGSFPSLLQKAGKVLSVTQIEGIETNLRFLSALVSNSRVQNGDITTRFIDLNVVDLIQIAEKIEGTLPKGNTRSDEQPQSSHSRDDVELDAGHVAITSGLQGLVDEILVAPGDKVFKGQTVVRLEAMKMIHEIRASRSGKVARLLVHEGDVVMTGDVLLALSPSESDDDISDALQQVVDPTFIRDDLASVEARRALGRDDARPKAVAKRAKTNQRTVRENIADLCDADSFMEYGELAIAAQRSRRSEEDLIKYTPADGMVTGLGSINGDIFSEVASKCAVLAYDYTVLAGTQGHVNHKKVDRLVEVAHRRNLPVILFSEGGGGRPGDTDVLMVAGLDIISFAVFAKLSGHVPLIGINSGRCFAGNAALLGCCDVIIATENSSIGMSGPAMIEGGGLGKFHPDEIGPLSIQVPNGVVDIAVKDEAEAVAVAKHYLSFFQGSIQDWSTPDQRYLRHSVPEDRKRVYNVKDAINTIVDEDSFLELREGYGIGIITGFARIEGRPIGLIANNPLHLGGAIDGPAADKAARFMQLCDGYQFPLISLCDTPGFMVGPETEKTAVVRRFARMFVTAAGMTTPFAAIILRKAYGLGALSMLNGNTRASDFVISWPTGECGGMNVEGAIQLGFRKEMEAIEDEDERRAFYNKRVAEAYAFGKAVNAAAQFEIDNVIDPADTRAWLARYLQSIPDESPKCGGRRSHIDTW